MSKFNTPTARAAGRGPISSEQTPSGTTFEGAPGFKRSAHSELFLLAVTNMAGEDTFYENAGQRDSRFSALVKQVALADLPWITQFAGWLRGEANMRSAALVLAAEAAHAVIGAGQPGARQLIANVLQRPDEPGEMVAYWHSHYGRTLPKPVKRGIADAVNRLYHERSLLKWDSAARGYRFGDVIQIVHPDPETDVQARVFKYAMDVRYGNTEACEGLPVIQANRTLRAAAAAGSPLASDGILAENLHLAGMTWEDIPALVNGPWTAALWEAIIPSMGYMALLRNLRNFDQAGVSDPVARNVAEKLSDPGEVARARQFPMRFLSAFNASKGSLRWGYALTRALDLSLSNIPALGGRTLILIDTSGSMNAGFSKDGSLMRWDAAAVFGLALARRCAAADVVSYSSATFFATYFGGQGGAYTKVFRIRKGEAVLASLDRWKNKGYFLGGGTDTAGAALKHFTGHDRVVVLTDEAEGMSCGSGVQVGQAIPVNIPLYTWNLAGYEHGHVAEGPNRYTFGGLTDAAFSQISLLESGREAAWPWETRD